MCRFYNRHPAFGTGALAFVAMVTGGIAAAAPFRPADLPLFLNTPVSPNLVVSLDDTGSMSWGYVPDSISDLASTARFKSSDFNAMYFNPAVIYTPPPTYQGGLCTNDNVTNPKTCYPNVPFTAAPMNGFAPTACSAVNLATSYSATASYNPNSCTQTSALSSMTAGLDRKAACESSLRTAFSVGEPNEPAFPPECADDPGKTIGPAGSGDSLAWQAASGVAPAAATPAGHAYYYKFDPTVTRCKTDINQDNCYVAVDVTTEPAAVQQNFANWYSYYRTRNLATVSAAMRAFAGLDGKVRVAWQSINTCTTFGTSCAGWDSASKDSRIRRLDGVLANGKTHKQELYEWLSRFPANGRTALRKTVLRVAPYFSGSVNINHPYADDPQYRDKPLDVNGAVRAYDACRRNIHLVMTDGMWNESTDTMISAVGDANSSSVTVPDTGQSWTPGPPYRDYQSNNMADIAFRDWITDLQPAMTNNVPAAIVDRSGDATAQWLNPRNDPGTWQHLNTYAVTLGVGSLFALPYPMWGGSTFAGDYSLLAQGTGCPNPTTSSSPASRYCWPYTTQNQVPGNAYDLWHAAIAGRGQFYSADSAQDVADAMRSIVEKVASATSSSAAVTANGGSTQSGALLFQARFDTADWHGELLAYAVNGNGTLGSVQWNAAKLIPSANSRNIVTYDGVSAQDFTSCTNLSSSQKAALDTAANGSVDNRCSDRLAWLRGDSAKEVRLGGIFRNRTVTALGDIVNSDPQYVFDGDEGYSGSTVTMPEKSSYADFVAGKAARIPMVYVGANDGMLHAFRADSGGANSGREAFAYVPSGVYGTLSRLTDPGYGHKYVVDGAPKAGDAYIGSGWKTVLAGGLGAGGKTIYALDVSDPATFGKGKVLWEYSDSNDLGYTYSEPQIAKLHDGQWAAIFGNGYSALSDKAFLYVVSLSDGKLIKKIPAGTATSNGLSTPVLLDAYGATTSDAPDKVVDFVYAGDLQGNLWKFDLTSSASAGWGIANGGAPLFSARNASNQVQPITAKPVVGNLSSGKRLVYFGTGQYLTVADPANKDVQAFYAIWDDNSSGTVTPRELQKQTIVAERNQYGYLLREISKNSVDWTTQRGWYLELTPPSGGPAGERVVSSALLRANLNPPRVIFVTMIPSIDPCTPGGDSWLMELDTQEGGAPGGPVFDFNGDGKFDQGDNLANGNVVGGIKSPVGIIKPPAWLDTDKPNVAAKITSGSSGEIWEAPPQSSMDSAPGIPVKMYWKQIQ